MPTPMQAILFDLDGVITDTAEYHYQSWQEMADAQGLTFSRTINERLRGVSRRESLNIILQESNREVDEATAQAWMASKNARYQELLQNMSRSDLLPGVEALLKELRTSDLKIAVASGSRNTPTVLDKLGITSWFDGVVAGPDPNAAPGHRRPKPAPDLFLRGADALNVPPAQCIVVEDAASGIDGAQAAGMVTVGIGPVERVGHADWVLPNLESATAADLLDAATFRVIEPKPVPTSGSSTIGHALAERLEWATFELWVDGTPFHLSRAAEAGQISDYSRWLDLRTGELHRRLCWTPQTGRAVELHATHLASLAEPDALVARLSITPLDATAAVRAGWRPSDPTALYTSASFSAFEPVQSKGEGGSMPLREVELGPEQPWVVDGFASRSHDAELNHTELNHTESNHAAALVDEGFAKLAAANAEAWSQFWREHDIATEDADAQIARRYEIFQQHIMA